jgi:predicted RNase H-like HicB family nuclease
MDQVILRCYAEGKRGEWEAICLDLDIAVQGDSFEQVYRDLNGAIENYVESLEDLPERERVRLLHRKAPLSMRVKLFWFPLIAALFGRNGNIERHGFLRPCPA